MFAMWVEIGRMLSWSSMTTQFLQDAKDRMNLKKYKNKTTFLIWRFNFHSSEQIHFKLHELLAKRLPLIKPSNHILMSLGPVSRVHVLEKEEGVEGGKSVTVGSTSSEEQTESNNKLNPYHSHCIQLFQRLHGPEQ